MHMESFLKTHQISVYTKNKFSWVDSLVGGGGKQSYSPNFINYLATKGPKFSQRGPKSESVVKFEFYCVNTFSDNSQKQPI